MAVRSSSTPARAASTRAVLTLRATACALGVCLLALVRDGVVTTQRPSVLATLALIALAAITSLLLWELYRTLERGGVRPVFAALVLVLAGLTVASALRYDRGDLEAYAGYAKLPAFADAYHPPVHHFGPAFAAVNAHWGPQLPPCVYGPLWLAFERALIHGAPSLAVALAVLRAVAALAFLAFLALLWGLTRSPALVAVAAVSPTFLDEYVAAAHNDLLAVVLCLAAILAMRRSAPARIALAILLAAAAGLVKSVFVVIALVAFARLERPLARVAACAAAIVLAAGVSVAWGGAAYVAAMRGVQGTGALDLRHNFAGAAAHDAAAALAVLALAAALFTRRRLPPASPFTFAGLGVAVYEWYLLWGLPFAAAVFAPRRIAAFVVLCPLAEAVVGSNLRLVNSTLFLGVAVVATIVQAVREPGRTGRSSSDAVPGHLRTEPAGDLSSRR